MKNKPLFVAVIIIIFIFVFSLAVTCNMCGTPVEVKSADKTEEKEEDKTTDETKQRSQQSQQTNQQIQGEAEAPTIELKIYMDATYKEESDTCFYRVEAVTTGNPPPDIIWSKDDSNGAWGDNIAQVNLTRDDPEYTLTGTAKNSVDTAVDDITLAWGCDGEEAVEEPENSPPEVSVIYVVTIPSGDPPPSYFTDVTYGVYVYAEDPDGDPIDYEWIINGGSFVDIDGRTIEWTTPADAGDYKIVVVVRDNLGAETMKNKTVTVEEAP